MKINIVKKYNPFGFILFFSKLSESYFMLQDLISEINDLIGMGMSNTYMIKKEGGFKG